MAVAETAIDIIVQFLAAIASKLPEVIQAGFDMIISFLNGMADAINNNSELLIEAFNNLLLAVISAGVKAITGSIELFKDAGKLVLESGLVQSY